MEVIKGAKISFVCFSLFIYVLNYVIRAVRWYYLLLPIKKVSIAKSFYYLVIGFFMNNIIPLRAGELIRAKIGGERLGVSRSSSLATIVIERLFDIVIFVALFFTLMVFMPLPEWIKKSFFMLSALFGIAAAVLIVISVHEDKSGRISAFIPLPAKLKHLLADFIKKFSSGLKVLKNTRLVLVNFVLSAAVWLFESVSLLVLAKAFDINLGFTGAILVTITVSVSSILPAAPGNVGVFEFAGMTTLAALGVPKDAGFALTATLHFLQLVVVFVLGFVSIIKEKISFADIFKFANNPEQGGKNEK